MTRKTVCDLCDRKTGKYRIEEKVRAIQWIHGWGDVWKEKYDICVDCWEEIGKKVRKQRVKN